MEVEQSVETKPINETDQTAVNSDSHASAPAGSDADAAAAKEIAPPEAGGDGATSPEVTAAGPPNLPALMKPKEAVGLLMPRYVSRRHAKDALVDLLKDGRISLYADYFWIARDPDIAKAYKERSGQPAALRKQKVDRKIFRNASQLEIDEQLWKWEMGNFVVKISRSRYAVILKSRFVASEIHYLAGEQKDGRKRDDAKRDEMWMAIAMYACDHGAAGFKTQKAVTFEVAKLLTAAGPRWPLEEMKKSAKTLDNLVTSVRKRMGLARRSSQTGY